MKTALFIISSAVLIFQAGCSQATESTAPDMYVSFEIESDFQDNAVKVVLDSHVLLDSKVTTNNVLSLAWSSGLKKLSRNDHRLQFSVIEYGVTKDSGIDIANDTTTILMRFDKVTRQISMIQIKGLMLRD